jgi:hypothetical protein
MRGRLFLTLLAGAILAVACLESSAHRSHRQHMDEFKSPCKAFSEHWYLDGDGEAHPRAARTAESYEESFNEEVATGPRAVRPTAPTRRS